MSVPGSWEGNTGMGRFSLAEAKWHYVSMDERPRPTSWGPGGIVAPSAAIAGCREPDR